MSPERPSRALFEPPGHLAALVLSHVGDVRDRLALECVSRVWRDAGQIPGAWEPRQDLTLSAPLATRLTDTRVARLLHRAGSNLRSLVINDAAIAFTGVSLSHKCPPVKALYAHLPKHRGTGAAEASGRGLHSSTVRLNVRTV
jgi:hypothetical protein